LIAVPPLLCLGGNLTLHKRWWVGCKRFTSGHGIAVTVSGVEAAIHCSDEFWFSVGMEMSFSGPKLAILHTQKTILQQL